MSRQRLLESAAPPAEQPDSRPHRTYTAAQIIGFLQISEPTFYVWKRRGELPWLEELDTPGRAVRYRADLVDRFLDGKRSR